MKITKIIIAVALATAILTSCGGDDVSITINKVTSDYEFDDTITVVPSGSEDVTVHESQTTPETSSQKTEETSSKKVEETSSEATSSEQPEISENVRSIVEYAAEYFFPDEYEMGFTLYSNGTKTIGGYECLEVEVFNARTVHLATYAVATEDDDVCFVLDQESDRYRIMTIGNTKITIGNYANTLVTHGVYKNEPSGYSFAYDGEPTIETDFNVTIFETPTWLVAIEGEVPTASLDFSDVQIRDAQENTVMREMMERLGLTFDWALESDSATVGDQSFVCRPFFAEYKGTEIEVGTAYYGYAGNGMFYKIVAFNLGATNSVSEFLDNIEFVERNPSGIVRDDRTVVKPARPNSADENGDYEETTAPDRPYGW